MTVSELASEWGVKVNGIYSLAASRDDPLPIRYPKGKVRSGFVVVEELNEWIGRNTVLYNERKAYA